MEIWRESAAAARRRKTKEEEEEEEEEDRGKTTEEVHGFVSTDGNTNLQTSRWAMANDLEAGKGSRDADIFVSIGPDDSTPETDSANNTTPPNDLPTGRAWTLLLGSCMNGWSLFWGSVILGVPAACLVLVATVWCTLWGYCDACVYVFGGLPLYSGVSALHKTEIKGSISAIIVSPREDLLQVIK